uniref:Uncharacterized protein n=1 Tax=Rhizophora mucronata TaxID=61149 RepID=A0A2P2M194_RHIMU
MTRSLKSDMMQFPSFFFQEKNLICGFLWLPMLRYFV